MDHDLFDLITEEMPQFNHDLVNGLAVAELENVEQYVDEVWKSAAADFPPGLTYHGLRRLKPAEEFTFNAKRGSNAATIEIARSDVYMVAFQLRWQGTDLPPVRMFLPIVEDGGIMHIRGSKYSIAPVIADPALSVGANYVFAPLLRDRITFYRLRQHVRIDGKDRPVYVVWSNIHHDIKKKMNKPGTARLVTTLQHYLFARFGVLETFRRYAGANIKIGTEKDINKETYPPDHWVLIASIKQAPQSRRNRNYSPSDVVIAVPKEEYSDEVVNLAGGFFYVADHFPYRVTAEDADETYLWCVLMGISLWGGGISEGQAAKKVEDHLISLDTHMDEGFRRDLREAGINIKDAYDLFKYLIDNTTRLLVEGHANLSSMYDKRLMVLRYVMKNVVTAINTFMYRVKANQKKPLTAKDISEKLNENIAPGIILGIQRNHGEVDTSVSSPGDNKYFKITSRAVKQVNSSGPKARSISLTDPANFLHATIAYVGSYLTPNGSSPTGHERLNPCVLTDASRRIVPNEKLTEMLDDVQNRIRRT